MKNEIIVWNYDKSVAKVKQLHFKWSNMTSELMKEIWLARENLSVEGRPKTGANAPVKTWNNYCDDCGITKSTANRWLERYDPETETTYTDEEYKEKKQEAKEKRHADKKAQPLPDGKYDVIYCDPPWKYDFSETESRDIENQYPTMEIEDICKLKIPSADNSVLFLWATAPKIIEAIQVISAWGFTYKTHAIWDKEIIGMGYWFRGQHEILTVSTKGTFSPPEQSNRISSVYRERRTAHSKKPQYYYKYIEQAFPDRKYLELYSRSKFNDKWTVWGNQI